MKQDQQPDSSGKGACSEDWSSELDSQVRESMERKTNKQKQILKFLPFSTLHIIATVITQIKVKSRQL